MSKNKNILVRADSSSEIGIGHIMRDLVLVKEYPTSNIIFACQDLEGNINSKILEDGYKVEILKSNSLEELDNLLKILKIDFLIIDHYKINYYFEKQLKIQNSELKILSFDDTYEKHYCDILLNHNISANEKKYKGLVSKNCELRCGPKYTLIRDEFYKEKRKKRKLNTKYKMIYIAMGGSDSSNINVKILDLIKVFKDIKVSIVTTTANKNLESLKRYCKNKKWINLYVNSSKVAKLMNKSDFAIISPSVTLNEVYFMNLPFIAIKVAENQNHIFRYLLKNKYLVLSKLRKKEFITKFNNMRKIL